MDFSMIGQDMPGFPKLLRGTMPVENHRQRILIAVPTVLYSVATVAVALRFRSRHIKGVGSLTDDYLCVVALILGYAQHATLLTMILGGGLGLDFMRIHISAMNVLFKSTLANLVLYFSSVAVLQLSILFLYTRIFGINRKFRWLCYGAMGLVSLWALAAVVTRIFPCGSNIEAATFMFGITRPDICVNTDPVCSSMGISHVILDFMILGLPIPVVWQLKTNTFNKFVITCVLMAGFFASICGILRMQCLVQLLETGPENATVALWLSTLYQSLEVPVGLICVCVPTLAPMWAQVSDSRVGSWAKRMLGTFTGSGSSAGSGSGKSSLNAKSRGTTGNNSQGFSASRSHGFSRTDGSLASSIDEKPSAEEFRAGKDGIYVGREYTVERY